MNRHLFAVWLPLLFCSKVEAAEAGRQPVAFPGIEACTQKTKSNISQYRLAQCKRVLGHRDAIPKEDWQFTEENGRSESRIVDKDEFDLYHRLFAQAAWLLIDAGKLSRDVFAQDGGHFGLTPFDQLEEEDIRRLVRAFAEMSGYPNTRAIILYLHAIPRPGVGARPLPSGEVFKALATIGGDVALDVLWNEGLRSEDEDLKAQAARALVALDSSGVKRISDLLLADDRRIGAELAQLNEEERKAKAEDRKELSDLKRELDKELAQLAREKAQAERSFAQQRRQLGNERKIIEEQLRRAIAGLRDQGSLRNK